MPETYKQKHKKAFEFQTKLGKEEVKQYETNMFKNEYLGGNTEADALIERYSKATELTEEERKILTSNVPAAPSFPLVSQEQYNNKSCWGRMKYRNRMKDYYKDRQKYYKTVQINKKKDGSVEETETRGQLYARTRQQIEERIAKQGGMGEPVEETKVTHTKLQESVQTQVQEEPEDLSTEHDIIEAQKEGYYTEIEEDAKAIDEAYDKLKDDARYKTIESEIGKKEARKTRNNTRGFGQALSLYSGPYYGRINSSLRGGGRAILESDKLINGLRKNPLNRDLVCRRGVKGVKTLASMMGITDYDNMTVEEIKNAFLEKYNTGEKVVLSDKSFMSTSLPYAESNFRAGDEFAIGIEFMILMKKGTPAMNIASLSLKKDEAEVLVAPGTKFKVIKAELDGDANIIEGTEKSWKIWLVSDNDDQEDENS